MKKSLDFLKPVFRRYLEIKLVYFFGSRAGQAGGPASDYDFAVYFGGIRSERMFSIKLDLIAKMTRMLDTDRVDIVILNVAGSPELKYAVVKEGVLIFEREPFKVIVEPKILNEYFDFHMMLSKHGLTKAIA
ncbi:MAG: type VII toxin-antitoxin system MntA family adenylyltransferase antitoxin [Nitrospirota bacterium]